MSNSSSILAYSLTTLVGLGGVLQGAEEDTAALTRRIERLEKQNAALKASYVQARSDADKAAAQLVDIRSRLEALGGAALGNSEERLIQAVADIESLNDRIQRLEQASVKLSGAILAYMKQAISEDANARTAVESSLRLLESVLGYRQQPVRDGAGTLAEAKVLSIDSESGVVVLNAGKTAGMQIGMPIQIARGAQTIGEAVVTDVRKEVCGALVQKLVAPADPVRVGDSASVRTND
ncbi:hypothetical protein [Akkermansia sp.]|uniref:hypothetical protein n=1 Tax=Akkermansia sp. TaxID=1872421 RepID=UPI0025B93C3E|nr:hypothetical protein [Akkermansia sp.]MCC8148399.1 hypothetical protein [Akkermansia sp.]